ncbi:MAG: magnesium transporter CorA family protein [Bauldia sp.]|nr:magnesium transporter CorA family protein [Bauldia sp.]
MLAAYRLTENGPEPVSPEDGVGIAPAAIWIDITQPSPAEERTVEAFLGAGLPSREETQEIEFSSRFYAEDGAVYMTASLLTGVDLGKPALVPMTIVVAGDRMATLRYDDLRAIRQFLSRAAKPGSGCVSTPAIFLGLIEAFVDRTADVLERISADVDRINQEIFERRADPRTRGRGLEAVIGAIGVQGDLAAKSRESLASLERLAQFASLALPPAYGKGSNKNRLKLAQRDIRSLEDHVSFLSNKITFLLDATLGLISVQQNEVIRVLTVAATIFFPPTLIGTIYGMNFAGMPELTWMLGYPFALALMALSAILPYLYFKRRGWL